MAPSDTASTQAVPRVDQAERVRTTFIDNLRVALTALVVFHHSAVTYGASGGWYYRAAPNGSSPLLTLFCTVNQAFFMGFFFLLAGYFTPRSLERKGAWRFLADRLLRLGVPLLVFGFLLDPLTVGLADAQTPAAVLRIWGRRVAEGRFGSGPLWFAQALLTFSVAYAPWCVLRRQGARTPDTRVPGHAVLLAAGLLTGAAAFALRLRFPVGYTVSNLQLGYFASYVVLFAAGVAAARGRWLERVPPRLASVWLAVSAVALLVLLASAHMGEHGGYDGGWRINAAIYAFFEPFFAWGVILGLLHLFQSHLNTPSPPARFLSARAYTVYCIHAPVLVVVARALAPWDAGTLAKFLAAGALGCAASLAAATLLLLAPGVRRVMAS